MREALRNCHYFLAYYAPSALRETRIAIGVVLLDENGRLAGQRFLPEWRIVRCLDPQADLSLLAMLPAHFEELASEKPKIAAESNAGEDAFSERLRRMEESFTGALQISQARAVQTKDPRQELDLLFNVHVAPRAPASLRTPFRQGSRAWVRAERGEALRRHGLWDSMERDVPVDQFTAPGDAFRIDFGYRPNGTVQYLHALSLERDWTQAKLLGYTYWRMREKTQARMTAIVADADAGLQAVQSCRIILAEAQIAVQPLSGIDAFLDQVR